MTEDEKIQYCKDARSECPYAKECDSNCTSCPLTGEVM